MWLLLSVLESRRGWRYRPQQAFWSGGTVYTRVSPKRERGGKRMYRGRCCYA